MSACIPETLKASEITDSSLVEDTEILKEKEINEEYKIWKKNNPFLYEYVRGDSDSGISINRIFPSSQSPAWL